MKTLRMKLALTAAVLLMVSVAGVAEVLAAFRATAQNDGNTFASGTVSLTDNDGDTASLSLSAAMPGATDSGCIKVTYEGSLPSAVRLYGTTSGTGLDQYLDLTVTRGVYSGSEPSFDSCTNFQADSTDYIGAGNGVIYDGTLQGYPDSYASGLSDPTSGSPETWTNGEVHVYMFDVTLQSDVQAEGKTASQTFTWEARNQ
jgi:hypothetical protein